MVKLSVNINKFATLRNARGGNRPDVMQAAMDAEMFGANGITVHPRPDGRHIRYEDVYALKPVIGTEFNIEGYPDKRFMDLVLSVKPEQVTLVPDPPDVLTSNAGWDTRKHEAFLKDVVAELHGQNIRTSLFLDPDPALVEAAARTGTDRIELYTEAYASAYHSNRESALAPYVLTAKQAVQAGLGINAGHDLDLENLSWLSSQLPGLLEVSIGHALVCDALYFGFHNTIQMYLSKLNRHHA
jgi:pyridoxine 5-phosphate synthase